MSTVLTFSIDCNSSDATEKFGEQLGQRLRGGEVIELVSDLGGGKTTLVRGIASGAGSKDVVASPSFTIAKLYKSPNFEIHHFDFYRLNEPGILEHELRDLIDDNQTVLIVEWADSIQHILPDSRLKINLTKTSDNSRRLDLSFPEILEYIVR